MNIYYIVMSGFEPRTLTQPDIMMLLSSLLNHSIVLQMIFEPFLKIQVQVQFHQ